MTYYTNGRADQEQNDPDSVGRILRSEYEGGKIFSEQQFEEYEIMESKEKFQERVLSL